MAEQKEKRCSRCGLVKPLPEGFYRHRKHYGGWCKICAKWWSQQQTINGYHKERHVKQVASRPPKPPRVKQPRKKPATAPRVPRDYKSKKKPALELLATRIMGNLNKRCRVNGRSLTVQKDDIVRLLKCFCENNYHVLATRHPFMPSLDRIDSSQGYTLGNVRVVWLIENLARNLFTDDQVIEFCRRKLGIPVTLAGKVTRHPCE